MSPKIVISENDLVFLLKSKDPKGFDILYNNYSKVLYGVLNKVVQSHDTASDLLKDSFLKIWKNIDTYDATKGTLFTWMLIISRNLALDKVHSTDYKNINPIIDLTENAFEIEEEYCSPNFIEGVGLNKVAEKLHPKYKQLIDLIYFKGCTQSEVSIEIGVPVGMVKTQIKTAILQLRRIEKKIKFSSFALSSYYEVHKIN